MPTPCARSPNLLASPAAGAPHRHAPILQTKPVDTSTLSAHESELAPRAASVINSPVLDSRLFATM